VTEINIFFNISLTWTVWPTLWSMSNIHVIINLYRTNRCFQTANVCEQCMYFE